MTCLVTGNLQPIGWGKMDALGLLPYFTEPRFGGFGSDYCSGNHRESWKDRAELVRVAAKRAQEVIGGERAVATHILVMHRRQSGNASMIRTCALPQCVRRTSAQVSSQVHHPQGVVRMVSRSVSNQGDAHRRQARRRSAQVRLRTLLAKT